jgi:hypothetical protein
VQWIEIILCRACGYASDSTIVLCGTEVREGHEEVALFVYEELEDPLLNFTLFD